MRDRAQRDAVIDALSAIYSGADALEADALLDQLENRGYTVERVKARAGWGACRG